MWPQQMLVLVSYYCCSIGFLDLTFPGGSDGKELACNEGDLGSIPGSETFPGEENRYLLQHSCLENSTDRGAWRVTVQAVAKSLTRLSRRALPPFAAWLLAPRSEAGSCLPLLTAVSSPATNSPFPAVYCSHILKSDTYGTNDTFLCKRKVNIL